MKCPGVSFRVSMGLAWLWGACLLMFRAVFLICWKISVVYLTLELVGSWVQLGFSVGMEALGGLLSINIPWNQEVSDVLKFWS